MERGEGALSRSCAQDPRMFPKEVSRAIFMSKIKEHSRPPKSFGGQILIRTASQLWNEWDKTMDNQSEESINGEKGGFIRMERASGREIKETVREMAPITRAIMMMQSVFWRQTRGNEGSKMYKRIFLYRLIHDNTSKWILINDFDPLSLFSSFFFFCFDCLCPFLGFWPR